MKGEIIMPSTNEWISTKDKLPDENGKYLCVPCDYHNGISNRVEIYRFAKNLKNVDKYDFDVAKAGFFDYDRDYGFYEVKVAYWLPIPETPKE